MIKDLKVKDDCISCGLCEYICPKNFRVNWKSEVVSKDFSNEKNILEAEKQCPVSAIIAVTWEEKIKILRKRIILNKKIQLTKDVFEFHFKFENIENFSFLPWQFITIFSQDWEWEVARSYSIVSWKDYWFVLCVKIWIWRWSVVMKGSKEWDVFFSTASIWNFILQETEKEKVFIATWTWIAPIIAMLKSCPENIKKTVVFWLRYEEDIFYKNILENVPNTKLILAISRPWEFWKWEIWRVTDYLDFIKKNKNLEIYICWSWTMLNSVLENLENYPNDLINYEAFDWIDEKVSWNKKMKKLNFDFIYWIQILLYIASWFVPLVLFYPQYWWFLWDISWYSVTILMLIRPLSDIFPKISFFKKLIVLRKWLWILSSSIVILAWFTNWFKINLDSSLFKNIFLFLINIKNHFLIYFNQWYWTLSWYKFFWHIAELTWVVLLITSNSFSQKMLWKNWKLIQKSAYIYFFAWWIYIAQFWKIEAIYLMLLVAIIWIIAEIKKNI